MYSSITPLEIRQKDFEKGFRGYEKEQVDAFLKSLSQEWERLLADYKTLNEKLKQAEKDTEKLREVETSLFKALKTAEDTGASMIDHANKSATIQLKEAKMESDNLVNDAKHRAKDLIDEAESMVREINAELREQIKHCENDFRSIENQRDNLLLELRSISNDTLERVDKYETKGAKLDVDGMLESIKKQEESTDKIVAETVEPNTDDEAETFEFVVNTSYEEEAEETQKPEEEKSSNERKSFFDNL